MEWFAVHDLAELNTTVRWWVMFSHALSSVSACFYSFDSLVRKKNSVEA